MLLPQHLLFLIDCCDRCYSTCSSVNMKTCSLSSPNVTPFIISVQDALLLENSEGFHILRKHLAQNASFTFCTDHEHGSLEEHQSWVLVRDIMHALLAPIVALHDHASRVAQQGLNSFRPQDLEYAYTSKARNAYVWLQSFLSSEQEWCLSQGCPGMHDLSLVYVQG